MNSLFTDDIIGSWYVFKSTHPAFKPESKLIFHFTIEGKHYREWDDKDKRDCYPYSKYRMSGHVLTFIYKTKESNQTKESHHELTTEADGSVIFPNLPRDEHLWWMRRLSFPEPYSTATVLPDGSLQRLPKSTPN